MWGSKQARIAELLAEIDAAQNAFAAYEQVINDKNRIIAAQESSIKIWEQLASDNADEVSRLVEQVRQFMLQHDVPVIVSAPPAPPQYVPMPQPQIGPQYVPPYEQPRYEPPTSPIAGPTYDTHFTPDPRSYLVDKQGRTRSQHLQPNKWKPHHWTEV